VYEYEFRDDFQLRAKLVTLVSETRYSTDARIAIVITEERRDESTCRKLDIFNGDFMKVEMRNGDSTTLYYNDATI